MEKFNFKSPRVKKDDEENVEISIQDLIKEQELKTQEKKDTVFVSNNQKYKKKEEIEYGKKSHLEFQKMMIENKDPLCVQASGGLRPITIEEVNLHNSKGDLWTVLYGNVYDLTLYVDYHPGGEKKLMMGAGEDSTFLFSKVI